ncbi:virion-associated phage protein [Burkholderia phage Bcep22]|uniref:Virion-associated phage protein n=1 Tax=Burkholderia phage Bcep22 TaxID=2883944 RepID=Q6V7N5_9CAUD|nr:structural protein [Burkholderia phage Bcep22]AAQ54991.1 virion-associated phage protein [Burkholderia phage Bcep22]
MPIAATDLIARAGNVLQDEDHIRWEVPELIEWINDAARETIVRRPAARSVAAVLELAAGTRQAIPERGVELLDVVRNMGADGVTPGRIVRRVDRQLLDDQNPDWHAARAKNVVKHFTFDERAPRIFYVYPPAVAGTKVETLHSELPPAIAASGDTLDMGAEYMNVLVSTSATARCRRTASSRTARSPPCTIRRSSTP